METEEKTNNSITTIVKPTNNCNMVCGYCYDAKSLPCQGKMNAETLVNSIQKLTYFNGKGRTSPFLWHGGEPLLAGLGFFINVVKIQGELEQEGYLFDNAIQTNGTLITNEIADFFKEYKFSVGISLDGPKKLNDQTRLYRSNRNESRSTFSDIFNSIALLKSKGIDPDVIVTLTKQNINDIEEIYKFFKANKINSKFNPLVKSGRAIGVYNELAISPIEYRDAKLKLLDVWFNDENPVHVHCLEEMFKGTITGNVFHECTFSEYCQKEFISIGFQGDVYPCPEFDGEPQFLYGNINTNALEEILSNPLRKRLLERSGCIKECNNCNTRSLCYGGCMRNAYAFTGDVMAKDPYCPAYKSLFKNISRKIEDNRCKEVKE
ncbi:MAG: radical SAM protein [Nanoarchaeota archaeon]|nr:radical SAM protein [Nanoarchaeota archaeon]